MNSSAVQARHWLYMFQSILPEYTLLLGELAYSRALCTITNDFRYLRLCQ